MVPHTQYDAALAALKNYCRQLVRDMVHEIIVHRDDFDGGDARTAQEVVAKHAARLSELRAVYGEVARYISTELPQGTEPLTKDDFRCFSCGYVIHRTDEKCRLCGWTWK
jgi:hypothetical protein